MLVPLCLFRREGEPLLHSGETSEIFMWLVADIYSFTHMVISAVNCKRDV